MKAEIFLAAILFVTTSISVAHGDEDHHQKESANIGPQKGIIEADEHEGFKLSQEAEKNFALKTVVLKEGSSWEIPKTAVLSSGEEINLYRLRNGFYKRVDFNLLSKNATHLKVSSKEFSKELRKGDAIIIEGVGFLRTAEIMAFDGTPEGHSH